MKTSKSGISILAAALAVVFTGACDSGGDKPDPEPVPVTGFGTVGVNWARGPEIPELAARFEIRTRTGDTWSEWTTLPYEPDHAPDPDSREGRHARPGTEPMLVGDGEIRDSLDRAYSYVLPDELRRMTTAAGFTERATDTGAKTGATGETLPFIALLLEKTA